MRLAAPGSKPEATTELKEVALLPAALERFNRQGRNAGLLGDDPILFLQGLQDRLVRVEAVEQVGRHTAVGALAAVFVDDVETHIFDARGRLSGHFGLHCVGRAVGGPDRLRAMRKVGAVKRSGPSKAGKRFWKA